MMQKGVAEMVAAAVMMHQGLPNRNLRCTSSTPVMCSASAPSSVLVAQSPRCVMVQFLGTQDIVGLVVIPRRSWLAGYWTTSPYLQSCSSGAGTRK